MKGKWLTMTGGRSYTELVDDVAHATSDELDDFLKVYRYDVSSAGIIINQKTQIIITTTFTKPNIQ